MFTYIISPTNNTISLKIAFTIVDDTITGYFAPIYPAYLNIPVVGNLLGKLLNYPKYASSHYTFNYFLYCLGEYKNKYELNIEQGDGHDHYFLHSHQEEARLDHAHYKLGKKVTAKILKNFFSELKKCELTVPLPKGETFFTKDIQNDIIKHFIKYQKEKVGQYFASNSDCYRTYHPTLNEHFKCLTVTNMGACIPFSGSNPDCAYLPNINEQPLRYNFDDAVQSENTLENIRIGGIVSCIAIMGTMGLFAYRLYKAENAELNNRRPMLSRR